MAKLRVLQCYIARHHYGLDIATIFYFVQNFTFVQKLNKFI